MRVLLWLILVGYTIFGTSALAAEFKVEKIPGKPSFIFVDGEFVEGDDEKFTNIAIAEKTAVVVFNSPGGLALVGMQIGKAIRLKDFSTAVADGQVCASSCGLAWLAGVQRFVFTKGLVGFHAIHTIQDGKADVSSAGNALVGSYLQQLGFNYSVVIYVTEESPGNMKWLSKADADRISLPVTFIESGNTAGTANNPSLAETVVSPPRSVNEHVVKQVQRIPEGESGGAAKRQITEITVANQVPFDPNNEWHYLASSDLPGNDLAGMPIDAVSPEACRNACNQTSGCVAFTQNLQFDKCFLKSSASTALQYTGAISGFVGTSNMVSRIGKDYGASVGFQTSQGHEVMSAPLMGYRGATLAWCQDTCVARKHCQAFNFYPSGDCLLLPAKRPTRPNPSVISGKKVDATSVLKRRPLLSQE